MSKAEDLANFLEFHFTEYERCHPNDAPMCESAAAELRRLAQVEAEHAALLKAISDAEPVAWIVEGQTMGGSVSQYLAWKRSGAGQVPAPLRTDPTPLYTLNGIKKP